MEYFQIFKIIRITVRIWGKVKGKWIERARFFSDIEDSTEHFGGRWVKRNDRRILVQKFR